MSDGRTAEIMIAEARKAFWVMVGFLGLIWVVQVANWAADYSLSYSYGIRPWDLERLPGVVSAPLLHWSWAHIEGNSGPLFIFGFLAAYRGVRRFLGVTGLIAVASGLGSWFTADSSTVGAGASGLVFGYFGYVLVRGAFDRHLIDIVIGLVMGLCFAYQFAGLLPAEGIGWQAHVFGFAGGILGGYLFRDRRAKAATGGTDGGTGGGTGGSAAPGKAAPPDSRSALLKEIEDLGL